ncbi:CNP1-like family protein [Cupriavidus sp. WS]|uniref:CNP1-like family protein n=1 Tax=Cupriavidus sp. WS TaxID=1312922 RepID=UPI0003647F25|nr:CNP1-like family protein [Cupriavidus sp. WS]
MIESAGRGFRSRLTAACLLAATLSLGLAGCGSTKPNYTQVDAPDEDAEDYTPKKESSLFAPLFGPREFNEAATPLPALPQDADLIPFEVSPTGNFDFAVDARSVVVGKDGAVRYTVVIRGPGGTRTSSFEGFRCDSYERKLFATLPKGAKEWVRNGSDDRDGWIRVVKGTRNNYANALATDFLCEGRGAAGTAEEIVRQMRGDAPRKSLFSR